MRHRLVLSAICVLVLLAAGCGDAAPVEAGGQAAAPASTAAAMDMSSEAADDAMRHESETSSEHMEMEQDEHDEDFAFGEPGTPAAADRTIDVDTVEEGGFHYEPAAIEVAAGETVTFRVHNVGEAVHEFVIGDEHTQQEHEAEMRAMASENDMMMHDDPNAVSLQPGETKELTWTFAAPGELIFGCHEPGHYEAGMRGDLTVTE